ncbi:hypothetical protein [Calothrix sp. UHCC 0171]|nr:hypothetical protein [Calothrix sp. UHCC 0171]MEA5571639.1 hypothetical protein [Calothrix sp. UHCC 0171]
MELKSTKQPKSTDFGDKNRKIRQFRNNFSLKILILVARHWAVTVDGHLT